MPRLVETILPPNIQSFTRLTWKYINPAFLATSGIYSNSDPDRLRNHITFPMKKRSILNTIARGTIEQRISEESISMMNLLEEKSFEKIAENAETCLWKGFVTFSLFNQRRCFAPIHNRMAHQTNHRYIFIHGYALHSIYGCGIHLLVTVWNSITHLLLYLGKPIKTKRRGPKRGRIAI